MIALRSFLRDTRAASAAEFALVLPLMLLFLFGIIDAGRYIWTINQTEKAAQIGARYAVVTTPVATDIIDYSFAVAGGLTQGSTVPASAFSGLTCTLSADGSAASCAWIGAATNTSFSKDNVSASSFKAMVDRMKQIDGGIAYDNVTVSYIPSGIGFAGDPNGPDVSPLVRVSIASRAFAPLTTFLFSTINLPTISYSLTMEDGSGSVSN